MATNHTSQSNHSYSAVLLYNVLYYCIIPLSRGRRDGGGLLGDGGGRRDGGGGRRAGGGHWGWAGDGKTSGTRSARSANGQGPVEGKSRWTRGEARDVLGVRWRRVHALHGERREPAMNMNEER
jgi:hypothetical protein